MRNKILISGLWAYVENGSAQIFSVITFLLIAKMVGPEEFGSVAIASAWSALFASLTEAGIGDAVIQKSNRSNRYVSTAFWLNLALALVGTLLVIGFAFTVRVSDNPKTAQYLIVLALGIPISALGNIPTSLLRADMRNKDLARRGIASDLVGCVAGITCAMAGLGGWAIIIQGLLANLTKTVIVWTCSQWVPERSFDRHDSTQILRFGYKSLGTGILSSISARTDRFVMGFFFNAHDVGIYALASEGINRISAILVTGLSQVMFPHYATLQNDKEKLAKAFFRSLSWSCFAGAAAFSTVYVLVPLIATSVLGEKWNESLPLLKTLTLLGLMQCILTVAMTLYKSVGRPGLGLGHAFSQVVLNILLIAIFKDYGLAAIALALALRPLTTLGAHVFTVNLILPGRKITFLKSVVSGLLLYGIVLVIETSLKTSHQPLRIAPVVALAFIALATAHRVKCEWTALKS